MHLMPEKVNASTHAHTTKYFRKLSADEVNKYKTVNNDKKYLELEETKVLHQVLSIKIKGNMGIFPTTKSAWTVIKIKKSSSQYNDCNDRNNYKQTKT